MANTNPPVNSGAAKKQVGPTRTTSKITEYEGIIRKYLRSYFSSLARYDEQTMVARVMGIMGVESTFNINHVIHENGIDKNTSQLGRSYWYDPVVKNIWSTVGTGERYTNLEEGLHATSLMGVMGMYFVRGTRAYNEMMAKHANLANSLGLIVTPGQSIYQIFYPGVSNAAERGIVAGMIVLQNKVDAVTPRGKGPSKSYLDAATQSYLGSKGAKDVNGMNPTAYLSAVEQFGTNRASIGAIENKTGYTPSAPSQTAQDNQPLCS